MAIKYIAEIGINHNGDINIAKQLIDVAVDAGCDYVKFQKRTPSICIPEEQKGIIKDTPWGQMTYLEYKERIEFGKAEYDTIQEYCKEKGIQWTASVWDVDSLEFISEYDVPFIKIASACINNLQLIQEASEVCFLQDIPLIISTGMSNFTEIELAQEQLMTGFDFFGGFLEWMHTNSSYPTPIEECNLNRIKTMKKCFKGRVNYSGHDRVPELTTPLAIGLGATYIERHITLDRKSWGSDQHASLEPAELKADVERARLCETLLGSPEIEVTVSEIPIRAKLRGNA